MKHARVSFLFIIIFVLDKSGNAVSSERVGFETASLEHMIETVQHHIPFPEDRTDVVSGYLPFLDTKDPQFRRKALERIVRATKEFQTHSCQANCFKKGKQHCRYRYPLKRFLYTFFCVNTGQIHLRRLSQWVNNFNVYLTLVTASNTDIQPLLKCKSSISIIYYITMYITKANQIDNWFALAEATKRNCVRTAPAPNPEFTDQQLKVRQFLLGIFRQAAKSTQISANIVATALLKLPLSYRSGEFSSLFIHDLVTEMSLVSDSWIADLRHHRDPGRSMQQQGRLL